MCPLCSETDVRRLGEPAPICEECSVEMEFLDGPDERTKRVAVMLDGGWEEEF
jgi:ribosomal protein L37AE/L43A